MKANAAIKTLKICKPCNMLSNSRKNLFFGKTSKMLGEKKNQYDPLKRQKVSLRFICWTVNFYALT